MCVTINSRVRSSIFTEAPTEMSEVAFEKGIGKHGNKSAPPPKEFLGVYDPYATLCGLQDKFQLAAVNKYLWKNGKYTLKHVSLCVTIENMYVIIDKCTLSFTMMCVYIKMYTMFLIQVVGDGSCMFASAWQQFGFSDDEENLGPEESPAEGKIYTPFRLRLQLILGILKLVRVRAFANCTLSSNSCTL